MGSEHGGDLLELASSDIGLEQGVGQGVGDDVLMGLKENDDSVPLLSTQQQQQQQQAHQKLSVQVSNKQTEAIATITTNDNVMKDNENTTTTTTATTTTTSPTSTSMNTFGNTLFCRMNDQGEIGVTTIWYTVSVLTV